MGNRVITWTLGIAATLAVVVAAVLAAGAIQKRVQQRQVAEMVRDTTEKLRQAGAARPNETWMQNALALKKRVENDYFDLNVNFKALDDLLFKLPDSERRLELRVGPGSLLEASMIASARKQTQDDARRARSCWAWRYRRCCISCCSVGSGCAANELSNF